MEDKQYSFYPPKPELTEEEQPKGHMAVTVFSLLLFVLTFVLIFGAEIQLLLVVVGVVLLHEMGHFTMMKLFRYENVRMLFIPLMGAFVHGKKSKLIQNQSILVILAGPIPGIAVGVIAWYLGLTHETEWLIELALVSFFLNVINLFPLQPLDGGRLLSILFFEKFEFFQLIFSFLSSLLFIGIGFYFGWYMLMIIGFLMGFQVKSMHRRYLIHKELRKNGDNYECTYDQLSDKDYHSIKTEVLEQTPSLQKIQDLAEEDEFSYVLAGEVKNILVAPMQLNTSLLVKITVVLLWLAAFFGPIFLLWNGNILNIFNEIQ